MEETGQPTSETEEVDDRASGKRRLIRGGGLVTRISDNKEPQFDNTWKYREQPVRKKDTMTHEETMLTTGYDPQKNIDDYSTPVPRYIDSDESDNDEMLPLGAFWPAPEEAEWTMVERSHGSLRSVKDIDSDRLYNSGDKLDHSGMRCMQLDYIDCNDNRCTSSEALPSNRKEATQNDRSPIGDRLMTGPASASVKPAVRKRPNVIVVEPRKTADRPVICPVNVVPTPQVEVHKSRCVGTCAG